MLDINIFNRPKTHGNICCLLPHSSYWFHGERVTFLRLWFSRLQGGVSWHEWKPSQKDKLSMHKREEKEDVGRRKEKRRRWSMWLMFEMWLDPRTNQLAIQSHTRGAPGTHWAALQTKCWECVFVLSACHTSPTRVCPHAVGYSERICALRWFKCRKANRMLWWDSKGAFKGMHSFWRWRGEMVRNLFAGNRNNIGRGEGSLVKRYMMPLWEFFFLDRASRNAEHRGKSYFFK